MALLNSPRLEMSEDNQEKKLRRLVTRRSALTTAGKAAMGVGALAVLGSGGAVASTVLGRKGGWAVADAPPSANPPSVGIFTYTIPSALSIDITHETVTLPL